MIITDKFDSDYSIIYPYSASKSIIYAVSELKKYLFRITGCYLTEYADNRHEDAKEIILGYTNRYILTNIEKEKLGDEGFIIKSIDEKIYILGSDVRGTLYGVYDFLEFFCGCRFYTRDFEKIPYKPQLVIDKFEDRIQVPQYFYRNSYWYSVCTPEISAKLKINGCYGRNTRFPEYLGGDVDYEGGFQHTIGWLSGQCGYDERAWVQPCLSSEETFNTVVTNIQKTLNEFPNAKLISITQNDGDSGACKCNKCKAINDREESEMGTMLQFVNKIAEYFEPSYPNVKFDTFAYRFTRKPPKTIRPRNNVIIRLCSIESCFRHPLNECDVTPGHDNCGSFKNDLINWRKIAPNMTIWNYTTNFTNFSTFFCNFKTLQKNENFFATNGIIGVFEQGNFDSPNGEFGELKGYLLAKLAWNPYMSEEEYDSLFNEFCLDYYGKSGKYIIEYIHFAENCSQDSHFGIYYDNSSDYINSDFNNSIDGKLEFINKGNYLFDLAENEADSPLSLAHIKASRIQLFDYIDFTLRELLSNSSDKEKERIHSNIISNAKLRFKYMRKYGIKCNREFNDISLLSDPDYETHVLLWNI